MSSVINFESRACKSYYLPKLKIPYCLDIGNSKIGLMKDICSKYFPI